MIYGGPNNIEDGLVFYFDAFNEKSYRGEPTVNFATALDIVAHGSNNTLIDNPPEGKFVSNNAGNNLSGKVVLNEVSNPGAGNNGGIRSTTAFNITGAYTYLWLSFYAYLTEVYVRGDGSTLGGYMSFKNAGGTPIGAPGWTFFVNGVQDSTWAKNTAYLNKWVKVDCRITMTAGAASVSDWYLYSDFLLTGKMYIARIQIEEKNHPTQYVNGTRSVTGSLMDITGRTLIDLTNATYYDTGAQIYFNGSTFFTTNTTVLPTSNSSPMTMVAWCKPVNLTSWQTVLGTNGTLRQIGFNGNSFYFGGNGGGGNQFLGVSGGVNNNWYMLAMAYDGTTAFGYLNGDFKGSGDIGANGNNNGPHVISAYNDSGYERFQGYIPMAASYNRSLSSREILQLYNATKGRYGL